ncbi:hypothetical protein LRD69_24300 [Streptomyces sp. JH14]|uniref:LppU/SCO3897 family protein n=1 Tax=Streptomyces sp. JH14 TaxID=2793630 RepID=UPI0023F7C21C|nr:hypothetical protein [Streptomyces sp. JH14]MDF6045214.1 hypothetical protein [Streptomyces sp. JH14]
MSTPPHHPPVPFGSAVYCRICGATPAAHVVVRGHRGLVITLRFLTEEGAFCRTCGTAVYRKLTSDTLWRGWWGLLSVFATPVTMLMNIGARSRIRALPHPVGHPRPPLSPGRRVLARPPALVVMAVLVLALATVTVPRLIPDTQPTFTAGDCVRNNATWPDQDLEEVGCSSPEAEFWISEGDRCWGMDWLLHLEYSAEEKALCAHPMSK